MDPTWASFYCIFTLYTHTDTDREQVMLANLVPAGTRSWDLDVSVVFLISLPGALQIWCLFLYVIALGQLQSCTGSADPPALANPVGSHS